MLTVVASERQRLSSDTNESEKMRMRRLLARLGEHQHHRRLAIPVVERQILVVAARHKKQLFEHNRRVRALVHDQRHHAELARA